MTRSAFLILTVLFLGSYGLNSANAVTVWWKVNTDGDWNTQANWSTDWTAGPVVNQLPVSGDSARMQSSGTSEITVTSNVDLGGGYFWSNGGYNSLVIDGTATPTWNSGSIYLSTPKDAAEPGFTIEDGTLTIGGGRSLLLAWNNTSNALGHFVQKAGTVSIAGNLEMAIKQSTQIGIYDFEAGDFSANNVYLGKGGDNQSTTFNQSGGLATINNGLFLGAQAGTTGEAIYNLDGGELTIDGGTPFTFTQPGGDVYFDFDGGTLNLPGTWDFTSLTNILDSNFLAFGEPALDSTLSFETFMIDATEYTRIFAISAVPEPSTLLLFVTGLIGLIVFNRRRKK